MNMWLKLKISNNSGVWNSISTAQVVIPKQTKQIKTA